MQSMKQPRCGSVTPRQHSLTARKQLTPTSYSASTLHSGSRGHGNAITATQTADNNVDSTAATTSTHSRAALTSELSGCPASTGCCRIVGCCTITIACRAHEQPSRHTMAPDAARTPSQSPATPPRLNPSHSGTVKKNAIHETKAACKRHSKTTQPDSTQTEHANCRVASRMCQRSYSNTQRRLSSRHMCSKSEHDGVR
jgi:hypothetical protein